MRDRGTIVMISTSPDAAVVPPVSGRFGQNLRALRERAGLTQRALARRLGFTGPSTVSHWEGGGILPAPTTITTLATALRCSTTDLLSGVVTPYDALRGLQELPSQGLLLSDDETRIVLAWRALDPVFKTTLRDTVLPAFVEASAHKRRTRRTRRRHATH